MRWILDENKKIHDISMLRGSGSIKTIKESNNILDLVDGGDLISIKDKNGIHFGMGVLSQEYLKELLKRDIKPDAIYKRIGNDYIMVAKKENGEWRVIDG